MVAVATWWLGRPYRGFGHDALYYAADAIRRVGDNSLNTDLFFGPGTQGDFSLYPWIYAALIRYWDIDHCAFALTLIGRLTWLASLAILCRSVYKGERATLAFGLLLLLPVYYDSHRVFSYGEPFETPRHWAEIAAMLGVAAALRGRALAAMVIAALACTIHPLMGLPGLAAVTLLLSGRARTLTIIAGGCAFILLLIFRAGPAAQLFHTYDDTWYGIVLWRNPYVLVSEWDVDVLARVAMWLFLLCTVAVSAPIGSASRRLACATAWTTGIFLAVWITGCVFRNVLILQLQLWRVLWLTQLVSPALVLILVPLKTPWRQSDRAAVAVLAAALLSDLWTCLPLALLAVACRSGLPRLGRRLTSSAATLIERSAYALIAVVAISRLARIGLNDIAYDVMMDSPHSTLQAVMTEPAATGLLAAALVYAEFRTRWRQHPTLRAAAFAIPLAALTFWIQQATAEIKQARPSWSSALKRELPAGTTVYWDSGPEAIWLLLGRASYASYAQGAGALFSRAPALELDRRLRRLEALRFIRDRRVDQGLLPLGPDHVVTLTDVQALCQDPSLDLVLLNGRKEGATQRFAQGLQHVSIFRCAVFRPGSSGAA